MLRGGPYVQDMGVETEMEMETNMEPDTEMETETENVPDHTSLIFARFISSQKFSQVLSKTLNKTLVTIQMPTKKNILGGHEKNPKNTFSEKYFLR